MRNICCVILNYNDAPTVKSLVKEIRNYRCLDAIVVVDNHSSDGSWEMLQALSDKERVFVLRTEKNGGYGAGNQAGIDYCVEELEAEYVIVANPDIHVTEECILRVKEALDKTERAVIASARVMSPEGERLFSYWKLLPLWMDLLDTGLVSRRLFKGMLNTPPYLLKQGGDENCRLVDAVPGSFFMLHLGRLTPQETKNLFDKHIFLYYEEKVLGCKCREKGLRTVLVTDCSYVHAHSVSIDKSVSRIVDKQRLLHRSKLYYYKEYLHGTPGQMVCARIFLGLVLAEVWFLTVVCRMKW